jgi:hypothetical protein
VKFPFLLFFFVNFVINKIHQFKKIIAFQACVAFHPALAVPPRSRYLNPSSFLSVFRLLSLDQPLHTKRFHGSVPSLSRSSHRSLVSFPLH